MGTKILVVDDDRNICELLKLYLENDGYTVFVANDGQEAVEMFQSKAPELVLLDIMLPKMDGWQVCREIRKTSNTPIIMLTAKGETFDKVLGLELGADDYVTKPFDAKEVMARVKAVLRRASGSNDAEENSKKIVKYDNLEINIVNYELKVKGVPVDPRRPVSAHCPCSTQEQTSTTVCSNPCVPAQEQPKRHTPRWRTRPTRASSGWRMRSTT